MKSKLTFLAGALLYSCVGVAEVVVIAHPSVNDTVSQDDLSRIFLGKSKSLPGGHKVMPLNLEEGNATREEFNDKVLGKNDSQLKSYWSKLIFTGKGQPPKDVGSDAEVKALVSANPNMIGYIDAANIDATVKELARF